jgi:uncharacterized protein with HEPN domain
MSRDLVYLLDIVQEAELIQQFVQGIDQETFNKALLHQRAVERSLTIIGEAARRLSDEFRVSHSELPWKKIVGMRNALMKDYDDVRLDIVWEVIQTDLPALVSLIAPLIPPDDTTQ